MSQPQGTATRGVAIATNTRCKICASPHRGEIEDWIALKATGGKLDDGTRVTEKYIFAMSEERWGIRLNSMNVNNHQTRHFRIGDPGKGVAMEDAKLALERKSREGGIQKVSVDDFLEDIVARGSALIALNPSVVTVDQALKAAAELTRRKSDDARERLMMAVVAGRGRALGLQSPAPPPADVEVEAVLVEEVQGDAEPPD